jgi:hypothetical protein
MRRRDEDPAFWKFLVYGLLAALLTILAMAVFPPLHKWLHHDAGNPDHQCVVTVISTGQIDRVLPAVVTFFLLAAGVPRTRTLVRRKRPVSRSSILEHAPPAAI